MILLKNGKIIKDNKLIKTDIKIKNGIIVEIAPAIENDGYEIIELNNAMIIPAMVDLHVHFREPGYAHKETIKSGSLSAAKGGFTDVMTMPNLKPVPDSYDNLKIELDIIKKDSIVNIYPYGALSMAQSGKEIANLKSLIGHVHAISDDGFGVNDINVLKKACLFAKENDIMIASHAEDNNYKNTDPKSEYVAVLREIEIAKETGCRYHFCHMSTKESFDAIRKAKREGYNNITCEAAPHHLILNSDMICGNTNYKMNPPLRSEEDRLATVQALIDGTVDAIASDHAPHSKDEKKNEFAKAPNGIVGLEAVAPIIYTYFVKNNLISYERFVDLTSTAPARIFKISTNEIKEGSKCNLAVLDINSNHIYTEKEIVSMGKNSPYIGLDLYGYNVLTIKDGKIIYKNI